MTPHLPVKWLLVACLFLPLASRAQIPGSIGSRGSISGWVVLAGNGRPAPQVRVQLWLFSGGLVATGFTGPSGEFEFNGLSSATYIVAVEEPDCEPIHETVHPDFGFGPLRLQLNKIKSGRTSESGAVVSVRELGIPRKARKAFQKGAERLAKKDPAGSLTLFQRAVTEFPNYYEAYYGIGVSDLKLGREGEAEQAFRKSIEQSGGRYVQPQFALGALLCNQEKFVEAEPIIRKGLELGPNSWAGHYLLGWALFGLNRLEEAEKSIREALLRRTDFAEAHLLLADIHSREKDYNALLKDLDAYLALDPNSATGAKAKAMRDDVQRALSEAQKTSTSAQAKP